MCIAHVEEEKKGNPQGIHIYNSYNNIIIHVYVHKRTCDSEPNHCAITNPPHTPECPTPMYTHTVTHTHTHTHTHKHTHTHTHTHSQQPQGLEKYIIAIIIYTSRRDSEPNNCLIASVFVLPSLQVEVEQKHYPRDPQRDQIHSGRVRVQLVNEEGQFCNDLAQNSEL